MGRTPAAPRLRVEERPGRGCRDMERIRETRPLKAWKFRVSGIRQ